MSTFTQEDVIEWAADALRPWQQDALRRLLETGPLTQADIDALLRLAKAPHFGEEAATASPPRRNAPRRSERTLPAVSVLGVSEITRVNALVSGPIAFGARGLTVVYGDNGSGKSGFVRILKRACRSIAPEGRIRPSIYADPAGPPAGATILYEVDGASAQVQWTDDAPRNPELATVNVFDAECARRQVERENRITYRPAVLQVFTDLATVSDRVRTELEREKNALGATDASVVQLHQKLADTEAGRFVSALSAMSSLGDLDRLAAISEAEERELASLRAALRENPLERAGEMAARARRISTIESTVGSASLLLNDEASLEFETLLNSERATREAAAAAADAFREDSPLEGLGTEAWKQLWSAARRFSEAHAYPGEEFPVTRESSLCVLCQQPLDDGAKQRLRHFEEFVRTDLQQRAEKIRTEVEARTRSISAIVLPASSVALGDVGLARQGIGLDLRRWLVLARARRRYLLRRARGASLTALLPLPPIPELAALREEVLSDEARLRSAAEDTTRTEMAARASELADREELAARKDSVAHEIARLSSLSKFDAAIRDCARTGITRKEGEAAQLVLSGALRAEFAENLAAVGFGAPAVEVELGGGQVGERPYKIRLTATQDVGAAEVLSEGEKTCVALAGFLAELATTSNRSGVVLDDPVCSLDHRFRDKVAERLAFEAQRRQVIVFTHDVVFLWELREHCIRQGVPTHFVELERGFREHGRATPGEPWLGKKVSERLGWIRNKLQKAEAALRKEGRHTYEEKVSFVYKRMRETWERSIEELLLYGVVERFRPGVETQRLRKVVDITQTDVDRVEREMARCSKFAHDEAAARNEGIPEPDVVRADLKQLEEWVEELRRRRR